MMDVGCVLHVSYYPPPFPTYLIHPLCLFALCLCLLSFWVNLSYPYPILHYLTYSIFSLSFYLSFLYRFGILKSKTGWGGSA